MIKVLITGMSENLGGINTYLYNLYKNANKNQIQFDFICHGKNKFALQEQLEKEKVKIWKITPRAENHQKHKQELKEIFLNNHYDFIHINIMSYNWYEPIILAHKYSKAKIILHSHNGNKEYLQKGGIKGIILDKIGKFKTRNIPYLRVACGQKAGEFMFSGKPFTIFYNGVNIEQFQFNKENRKEIRKELKIDAQDIVIGQVASLTDRKRPLFLLDIFYAYHQLQTNSKLVIVGTGPLMNKLKEKIKEYDLEKNVFLLGKREDTNRIYSAFDVFVMPSMAEGMSISLVEAQTNGLKCFTSKNVDKTSNITGNVTFLSLENNAKEWAERINHSNIHRDIEVKNKIPDEFDDQKSYEKVYQYYEDNLS